MTSIINTLSKELGIKPTQTEAAIKLIDEGNTIPFIARYRKEVTGSLDDEVLRNLYERLVYLRNLEEKKETILKSIEEQGKLTDELRSDIEKAETMVALDDLYLPYRPKKRTRATIAKEKGLEPLSNMILLQQPQTDIYKEAEAYVDTEKEVDSAATAIKYAMDILAELISESAELRTWIRKYTFDNGDVICSAKDPEAESVYEMYYEYAEAVKKIPGHRILAINRGEKEKFITVKIQADEDRIHGYLEKKIIRDTNKDCTEILKEVIKDSYKRLIFPSIERDIRNELTEKAEDGAISVFGKNLSQLLMQPPIANQIVLGWDPGFRTGCKIAVVDATGKVLDTTVVYPTAPHNKIDETKKKIHELIDKHGVTLISLGNGTASRESEQVIVEIIKECKTKVSYLITNEAGASVYSASKLATEEFPNFDVGQRSATSMARRVQDPLAELVKIDPKSIGVGQYQHDMNQKKLSESLCGVVEDCVNKVGVDLNTASVSLLEYVSGISKAIAKNIVTYRDENGLFNTRQELLKVPKLGSKAFEQCAGFLRIRDGKNPLDNTGVHPESYKAANALLKKTGLDLTTGINSDSRAALKLLTKDTKKLAAELEIGEPTLKDIIKELEKPGRDPRDEMPTPILKSDVLEMSDLKPGMILKGTVRNIIDFGAFIDIGVHQDGLVHISQISDKYIKHPLDVLNVGDIVDVAVMSVDEKKGRIALTMKNLGNK